MRPPSMYIKDELSSMGHVTARRAGDAAAGARESRRNELNYFNSLSPSPSLLFYSHFAFQLLCEIPPHHYREP